MEGCDEVVVTCSKDDAAIHVWNPSTAQHLRTFKNNTSGRPNAWSLVGQHHMLAIQEARPSIHVWSWARVRPPPNNPHMRSNRDAISFLFVFQFRRRSDNKKNKIK